MTLLLGKDGEAADVISPSASNDDVVGYIIGTGTKEYNSGDVNTYKNFYIKIVQADGNSYEYVTDKDYSEYVNSVVKLNFSNGYARIATVSSSSVGGVFNWSSKKFGSDKLSASVNILDVGTLDKSEGSAYTKVYGQRLEKTEIQEDEVLYADKNSSGEITSLILKNVTGDAFEYALIVSTNSSGDTKEYTYMVNGSRYTISAQENYSVAKGDVFKLANTNAPLVASAKIKSVSGKATMVSTDKITVARQTFALSDKVACYKGESTLEAAYSMISVNDLVEKYSGKIMTVYYDEKVVDSQRKKVRVVVVGD